MEFSLILTLKMETLGSFETSQGRTLQEHLPLRPGNLYMLPKYNSENEYKGGGGAIHQTVRHSNLHSYTHTHRRKAVSDFRSHSR
jgi:hypothetical protein